MSMKIERQAQTHRQSIPLLPWEVVALGTPRSGEPPMIEGQAAFYRAIVVMADLLHEAGVILAKWKRAASRPRAPHPPSRVRPKGRYT